MNTDTERTPCKNAGRDWSDIVTNQRTPRIVSFYQKLGRGKEGLFLKAFKESMTP